MGRGSEKTNPIQTQTKPISNVRSDVAWIPAFAGMTNMESLLDGKF